MGSRVRRGVAEAADDSFYVAGLTGEKEPAWSRTEMIGVLLHYGRRIARGIGSDRDQCDLTADAIAEQILYPRYLLVDHWTGAIAVREKKVDQDDLVLEDVGEEAALLSILCDHRKIGEIAVGLLLSCRGRPSFRLGRRAATGRSRAAMVV